MWNFWRISLLSAFLLIVDQLMKGSIQTLLELGEEREILFGLFKVFRIENPGKIYGFFSGAPIVINFFLFKVLPLIICIWMLYLLFIKRENKDFENLSYGIFLTGIFGNWMDRVSLNYIVEYLKLNFFGFYSVGFNLSDICIAVSLFIFSFSHIKKGSLHETHSS